MLAFIDKNYFKLITLELAILFAALWFTPTPVTAQSVGFNRADVVREDCATALATRWTSVSAGVTRTVTNSFQAPDNCAIQINYDVQPNNDINRYVEKNLTQGLTTLYQKATFRLATPGSGGSQYGQRKFFYNFGTLNCTGSDLGNNECFNNVLTSDSTGTTGGVQLRMQNHVHDQTANTAGFTSYTCSGHANCTLAFDTNYVIEMLSVFTTGGSGDYVQIWVNGVDVSQYFKNSTYCPSGPCINVPGNIILRPTSSSGSTDTYNIVRFGAQMDPWDKSASYSRTITSISQTTTTVTINHAAVSGANPYVAGMTLTIAGVPTGALNQQCTNAVIASTTQTTCTSGTSQTASDSSGTGTVAVNANEIRYVMGPVVSQYGRP